MDSDRSEPTRLVPIGVSTLLPADALRFDLYMSGDPGAPHVLFKERSYPLDQEDLDRLIGGGLRTLYIPVSQQHVYRRYLQEEVVENETIAPVRRYEALLESAREVFSETLQAKDAGRAVDVGQQLASQVVDVVCGRDVVLLDLFCVMQHDYYTYTHVTNVCTYSLMLAEQWGITAKEELEAIAVGALLHDIGKRHIPACVLNKPGPLDDREWEMVRAHPRTGFEELSARRPELGSVDDGVPAS